jgi:hypothetical protein
MNIKFIIIENFKSNEKDKKINYLNKLVKIISSDLKRSS